MNQKETAKNQYLSSYIETTNFRLKSNLSLYKINNDIVLFCLNRLWNSIHPPPSSSSCASTHSLPSDESRVPPTGVSDQPFSLPVSMESSPGI
jgi:hypothetical protein